METQFAPHAAVETHDKSDQPSPVLDRTCSLCGRGQTELEQVGHTLRFLCPDEVCTECIDDDVAAA